MSHHRLMLVAATIAALTAHATAAPGMRVPHETGSSGALVQLADARADLHCHSLPRHTRCHKSEWLPEQWRSKTKAAGPSTLLRRHPREASRRRCRR
jgi:hypothetical protein